LAGRRILVTGASSGIGRAISELFAREGAKLALLDREPEGLAATARQTGGVPIVLDLADSEAIEPAVKRAASELGGLDGVVNCAGIGTPTSIDNTDLKELNRFIAINLTAPYLICRAAVPFLREAEGSTIVNIASGMGLLPTSTNNTAYAATKGGLIMFSKSLAVELAPKVRVNALAPGVTRTPMTEFLVQGANDPSTIPFVQAYPMKRMAEPIEMANGVLFLTSRESSYVTGICLAVDGGRTLH
jgi:NAD(P)-dependent dehydrogenase (short-subunit alcohol dehydrogenase family)